MTLRQVPLRRWLTLVTSFLILAVAFGFSVFCWPALYRPLVRVYGWSFASANAGGAIVLLLVGVLSPLIGTLVDKYQPKPVILCGTVIIAAALALLSNMRSLGEYYACCVLLGLGASAVSILPASILIAPFFSRWRGLAVGFINAGIGLGGFVAPRLVTDQIAGKGMSGAFLALSVCMAIPFLLTLIVVRNQEQGVLQQQTGLAPSLPQLIRQRMFWIFGAVLFLSAHAMFGVQQNLISYLTGAHVAPKEAALVLAIALGSATPGKLICGVFADRFNARAGLIFSIVCVIAGVFTLLMAAPQSAGIYWPAIVFGLGFGGVFNAAPTIVFEHLGTYQVGKAQGVFYMFFGVGTASGGEVAGYLFDQSHRWQVPFTLDLILASIALLLLLIGGRSIRYGFPQNRPAKRAMTAYANVGRRWD